jgi:hypothetical protein
MAPRIFFKQGKINCFITLPVLGSIPKIEPILKEVWQGSLNGVV